MIGKRQHLIADDLAQFMSLAGDHENIPWTKLVDGRSDGERTLTDLAGSGGRHKYLGPDARRFLPARIVVRDVDAVGLAGRHRAHMRPLAPVAIAATTEHHCQRAAGIGSKRIQNLGEGIG